MSIWEMILLWLLPHRDIIKDGRLYLRRFYLTPKWFRRLTGRGLFIHHIIHSDEDRDPHDHPWSFLTIMLKGRYVEHLYRITHGIDQTRVVTFNVLKPFRWLYRRAESIHRVFMTGPCWTLVFVGKTSREWGFWTHHGWVHWRTYLGLTKGPKDS